MAASRAGEGGLFSHGWRVSSVCLVPYAMITSSYNRDHTSSILEWLFLESGRRRTPQHTTTDRDDQQPRDRRTSTQHPSQRTPTHKSHLNSPSPASTCLLMPPPPCLAPGRPQRPGGRLGAPTLAAPRAAPARPPVRAFPGLGLPCQNPAGSGLACAAHRPAGPVRISSHASAHDCIESRYPKARALWKRDPPG